MNVPAFNLELLAPTSCVAVYRLNDHEWWAGASLQACIDAAGLLWGMTGEELAEQVESASEINDADLDSLFLLSDEHGTRQSFRQALRQMQVEGVKFPAFFAGAE
jgi:hypothetical protein